MASKRMKNRVYWAVVKASTYHPATPLEYHLKNAYHAAFKLNDPDSMIIIRYRDVLSQIEAEHGPAGIRNVHNRDLWTVRERYAMSEG